MAIPSTHKGEVRLETNNERIMVLLVDDQAMIRAALKSFLAQRERFEIVGTCGDARRAVEEIAAARPHVVVLDITMPGLSGLDAVSYQYPSGGARRRLEVTWEGALRWQLAP